MVPGFHVLGFGDPLRGNDFRMMQNLVVNFAFVQTINQLFWYFQKQPPMQTITFPVDLYFPGEPRRAQDSLMDPYAKPDERKVGGQRPKISHLPGKVDKRTRKERQAEKQAVAAERRAIKKSARRHLKQQLHADLEDID